MNINPREPMTKKARHAIEKYVHHEGEKKGNFTFVLVDACLKAERMPRKRLYETLERYGYRWKKGYWLKANKKTDRR